MERRQTYAIKMPYEDTPAGVWRRELHLSFSKLLNKRSEGLANMTAVLVDVYAQGTPVFMGSPPLDVDADSVRVDTADEIAIPIWKMTMRIEGEGALAAEMLHDGAIDGRCAAQHLLITRLIRPLWEIGHRELEMHVPHWWNRYVEEWERERNEVVSAVQEA